MMTAKNLYLMENDNEGERLRVKGDQQSTSDQLIRTGLLDLPDNPMVVDAGCGVGFVSEIMADLLNRYFESSTVNLVDLSQQRLDEAQKILKKFHRSNYNYHCAPLDKIPLPCNSVDYVFSRFVFEYLQNQEAVFTELKRILKPGGKMVIADLDYNCMNHYPIEKKLQDQLMEMMKVLQTNGLFDPYAGRKLFTYFKDHHFKNIDVHVEAHHLFCGPPDEPEAFNWQAKMKQMGELQKQGVLDLSFSVEKFAEDFNQFLQLENRFSYTPIIIVQGVKS